MRRVSLILCFFVLLNGSWADDTPPIHETYAKAAAKSLAKAERHRDAGRQQEAKQLFAKAKRYIAEARQTGATLEQLTPLYQRQFALGQSLGLKVYLPKGVSARSAEGSGSGGQKTKPAPKTKGAGRGSGSPPGFTRGPAVLKRPVNRSINTAIALLERTLGQTELAVLRLQRTEASKLMAKGVADFKRIRLKSNADERDRLDALIADLAARIKTLP